MNNNPLKYTDPSGHCFDGVTTLACVVGVAMAAGAVIGGVANAYQQYQETGQINSEGFIDSAWKGALIGGGVILGGAGIAGGIAAVNALSADGDPTNEIYAAKDAFGDLSQAVGDPSDEMSTVGRWMSPAEYNKMVSSGTVQESYSGITHVAYPANPTAYGAQAAPGSYYVQFNVPSSSLRLTSNGWASINGPNSLVGRYAARNGLPIPQMPPANNIQLMDMK